MAGMRVWQSALRFTRLFKWAPFTERMITLEACLIQVLIARIRIPKKITKAASFTKL